MTQSEGESQFPLIDQDALKAEQEDRDIENDRIYRSWQTEPNKPSTERQRRETDPNSFDQGPFPNKGHLRAVDRANQLDAQGITPDQITNPKQKRQAEVDFGIRNSYWSHLEEQGDIRELDNQLKIMESLRIDFRNSQAKRAVEIIPSPIATPTAPTNPEPILVQTSFLNNK